MKSPYNRTLVKYSRKNRSTPTFAEKKLWKSINKDQLGFRFRRQHPILNYIVDFYCIPLKLIIEIDGSSHDENKYLYGQERQKSLENLGNNVLRFTEYEVMKNTNNVIQTIENFILMAPKATPSQPSPTQGKEKHQ